MTFPQRAHVKIGPYYFTLDESQIDFGNLPLDHYVQPLFSNTTQIVGEPGARNINPDQLPWHQTEFVGEGQLSLKHDDEVLAHRFYLSEGLDFRTAGQFSLNRSTVVQSPQDSTGGATATVEGNSFTDVTGTSTVVNTTDRRLNVVNDEIQGTVFTPGAGQVQTEFFLYNEGVQYTTIEGSDMVLQRAPGAVSGTNFVLKDEGAVCRTTQAQGTGLTAGEPREVNWYIHASAASELPPRVKVRILNTTDADNHILVYESAPINITGTVAGTLAHTTTFTPRSGKTYQFRTTYYNDRGETVNVIVDKITHGIALDPDNEVRVVIWNDTASAEVSGTAKTVNVTNTTSANIVNITWTAAAATNYKPRVRYTAGQQRPITDKVTHRTQATGAWTFNDIELGLGGNVILAANRAGAATTFWKYDFANNDWDEVQSLTGATNVTIRALAHTDKWEYFLGSDGIVYQADASTTDNDYIAAVTGAVGMAICQDRLFVLSEDATNGVDIATYAVDADVSVAVTAQLATTAVTSALNTADTSLRQRVVGTPTGARFFVNFSDVTSVIYEADTSSGSLVVTELARLDHGAKATCITYVGGITFIGGQFLAETGQTPVSALWAVDQQDQLVRVGYFRRDASDSRAPQKMVPYESDLWILQGNFMWRYSLVIGGLFLEYEMNPGTPANQMALAVTKGHQFAVFSDEGVFTTGSVGTYRPNGSHTSSVNHFGLPGVTKQLDFIEVTTNELPASTALTLEYQIDQDGTWVNTSTFTSGSKHRIRLFDADNTVLFENLQTRLRLQSLTGVNTPTVRAIKVRAFPAEEEEFLRLLVRVWDEDSSDRIQGQQHRGSQMARALKAMQRAHEAVSVELSYDVGEKYAIDRLTYLCRIEGYSHKMTKRGEGSLELRLRVLD